MISNLEHPGGTHPWRLKEKRFGIQLKDFPIGVPPKSVDEIVESFKKAITPKTKVLSISQTVYITGLIAPIKELAEEAHKRDILVAVDSGLMLFFARRMLPSSKCFARSNIFTAAVMIAILAWPISFPMSSLYSLAFLVQFLSCMFH